MQRNSTHQNQHFGAILLRKAIEKLLDKAGGFCNIVVNQSFEGFARHRLRNLLRARGYAEYGRISSGKTFLHLSHTIAQLNPKQPRHIHFGRQLVEYVVHQASIKHFPTNGSIFHGMAQIRNPAVSIAIHQSNFQRATAPVHHQGALFERHFRAIMAEGHPCSLRFRNEFHLGNAGLCSGLYQQLPLHRSEGNRAGKHRSFNVILDQGIIRPHIFNQIGEKLFQQFGGGILSQHSYLTAQLLFKRTSVIRQV